MNPAIGLEDGFGGRGGLSINLATIREQGDMEDAVEACARHGIRAISPWRDQVSAIGQKRAVELIRHHGLRVTGLCRGGMFTGATDTERRAAVDDNLRAIEEAAALGANCLVLVCGGLPAGSRDLAGARTQVAEGIAAIADAAASTGVRLAIEPLHPMYAADRNCISTLCQALDIAEGIGSHVGVAIDAYHVWFDPDLPAQIARAGASNRIFAHHICDWLVPTKDMLLDRGMMGDGVIDLTSLRDMIEAAGFHGPQEVEIFSVADWWTRDVDDVLTTCIERYGRI